MVMQNFQIQVNDNKYYVVFNQAHIGMIEWDSEKEYYIVRPNGAPYSCEFYYLDEAIVELVFHNYRRTEQKIHMC